MGKRLVVVAEREHSFLDLDDRASLSIGRSPENDIVVKDDMVSRRHALIERDPEGELRVRDLKSFNGTYLNERRVRDEPFALWDALRVGRTKMFLVEREHTAPLPTGTESSVHAAADLSALREADPEGGDDEGDGEGAAVEGALEADVEQAMSKTRTLDAPTGLASKEMRALVDDVVRREREALERDVARRVRDESGPAVLATLQGLRVRVSREGPADGGGDFYDVFRDALLPNALFLALGSVSGVGIPACVAATVARHTLRGFLATRDLTPGDAMVPVTDVLSDTLHPGSALSLLLARVDHRGGPASTVKIAALGGCGVLHYVAASDSVTTIRAPGRRDEESARVQVLEAKLKEGDRLILTGDGAGAMRRGDGEPYGAERLAENLGARGKLPLKELLAEVGATYETFGEGSRERDVTLIAMTMKADL